MALPSASGRGWMAATLLVGVIVVEITLSVSGDNLPIIPCDWCFRPICEHLLSTVGPREREYQVIFGILLLHPSCLLAWSSCKRASGSAGCPRRHFFGCSAGPCLPSLCLFPFASLWLLAYPGSPTRPMMSTQPDDLSVNLLKVPSSQYLEMHTQLYR